MIFKEQKKKKNEEITREVAKRKRTYEKENAQKKKMKLIEKTTPTFFFHTTNIRSHKQPFKFKFFYRRSGDLAQLVSAHNTQTYIKHNRFITFL